MTLTVTLKLSPEAEEKLKESIARKDSESARQILAEAVAPTVENLLSHPVVEAWEPKSPDELNGAESEAPAQERADLRFDLDALVSALPDRCRSVLRLRYGLGCSTAEAAERMGYCKSSVRKVTRRCLAALTAGLLGQAALGAEAQDHDEL